MLDLLKKPLMKRGTGAICALGILLGVQAAALADSYDVGWKLGANCFKANGGGSNTAMTVACLETACGIYYTFDGLSGYNTAMCVQGALEEILYGPFGPGGSGISTP